jgi:hypothetical protein
MRKEKKKVVNPSFFQFFVFLVLLFSFGTRGEAGELVGGICHIHTVMGKAMAGLLGGIFLTGVWIGISSFVFVHGLEFSRNRERERTKCSGVSM